MAYSGYAIPPQTKGIADVLNDATDANERGLESTRKTALTLSQLKGEQQRQALAQEQAGRERTRFGFETNRLQSEQDERDRQKRIREEIAAAGKKSFEVEETVPGAIRQDADGAQIRDPDQKRVRVIDPFANTPESVAATANWLGAVGRIRMANGDFTPEQIKSFQETMDYSEKRGIRSAVNKWLASGDTTQLQPVEQQLGLDKGTLNISVGKDPKTGMPTLTATGMVNGKQVARDMEAWFAMNGITELGADMDKKLARSKTIAETDYNIAHGKAVTKQADAAMMNAETNRSKNNAKTANADAFTQLSRLEQTYQKNNFAPGFSVRGPDGKSMAAPDDEASNIVTRIGSALIDGSDATGGQAHVRARSLLGEFNATAKQSFDRDMKDIQTAYQTVVKQGKPMNVQTSDGQTITLNPKDAETVKKIKDKMSNYEDNGVQIWQNTRNQMAEDWLRRNTQPAAIKR